MSMFTIMLPKPGAKVRMNGAFYVQDGYKDKVFTVASEPYWFLNRLVVKLEGFNGCYPVQGLSTICAKEIQMKSGRR